MEIYLLNDMNGDEKGEICRLLNIAGSGKYALSFGNKPPDLEPDVVMNAGGISRRVRLFSGGCKRRWFW